MKFIKALLKFIRVKYLLCFKYNFVKVGKNFYCGKWLYIRPNSIIAGNDVYIGYRCHLSVNELIIGNYVMLASNVSIVGGDHKFDVVGTPIRSTGRAEQKTVVIEDDVWVGHGVTILHGVAIGEGSIIAAGSLVTKSVEPYSIYAGAPAKKIRDRFPTLEMKIEHSKKIKARYYLQFSNQ